MSSNAEMEARVAMLEDRVAIQELAVLYGFYVDERDVDGLSEIFCADAALTSEDGTYAAEGLDEILQTYRERFTTLGPSYHYTHGHVVRFDPNDPDAATGLVAAHAEVQSNGTAMQVGLRYKDAYRRVDEVWRFERRTLSFMYYMPFSEMATDLGDRYAVRMTGDKAPSDWPEALYSEHGNAFLQQFHR